MVSDCSTTLCVLRIDEGQWDRSNFEEGYPLPLRDLPRGPMVSVVARFSCLVCSRRVPKSLAAAGPVACRCGSVYGRWAIFSRIATSHSVTGYVESGRGDETPLPACMHWEYTGANLHPRMLLQNEGGYNGEGAMQRPHPKAPTIYYDDVSSGPRPRAHWYMLTHRAAAMRLPTGPRIALHRVPVPSLCHYSA